MTSIQNEELAIRMSDIATGRLIALALTLPVVKTRNDLFGRSHAWYAIAHSQARAVEFAMEATPEDQRGMAARALALAGHELRHIRTLG